MSDTETATDQAAVNAMIAELAAEYVPPTDAFADPAEPAAPAPAPAETPAAAPVAAADPATAPPPAVPNPETDTSRGVLRLLEREKAASDREAALERRARELETQAAGVPADAITPQQAAELFQRDPLRFCQAIGIEPEQVSRAIIAAKLGDKAPAAIRDAARDYPLRQEMAAHRAELASLKAQLEVERARAGLPAFVATVAKPPAAGAERAHPVLADLAGRDPEAAVAEIDAELEQSGYKITREAAAEAAEKRLAKYQRLFAAPAPAAAPQPSTTTAAPTTAPPAATQKAQTPPPPRRPAPYWVDQSREDEVAAALAEAVATAKRTS